MRKFKLIKEYPGSGHVGITVSRKTLNGMYEGWEYNYYTKHVENNPEYWEEVIEKDYEIISYVAKDCDTIIVKGPRTVGIIGNMPEDYWKIHSVKRLSDGEVFTVGDRITGYWYKDARSIQTIKICIYTGSIRLEQSGGCTYLSFAKKAKQPIFLTHDGKDIFPEDTVWYVNKENLYHDYIKAYPEVKFNSEIRAYFLTEEEAEDYVYRTKVLFTTEDGVGIKRGDTFYFVDTDLSIGLSNTKYEKCDGRKYFSTFETAQYYMIVNAKVLSIEEFWEFVSKPGSNVVKQKALKRLVKERLNLK